MNISDLFEGYVKRNGEAMKVGSLRLHFYPDHVFYVDGTHDLSIYRDGAFKPPRNNEIYLKDAARLGIPKDFFTIVSTWLNTPIEKQEALLDRIHEALEYIAQKHLGQKEDLDEGNKENKKKLKDLKLPRDKTKMSNFDPRTDLKVKETTMKMDDLINEGPRGLNKGAKHDWAQNKTSQASRRDDGGWSKSYKQPGEKSKAELSAMAAKAKADYDKKKGIHEEEDHEASMAKGQLYSACKNAMALMKMIEDGDNLEGWVAAKITKASDYIAMVHDYMAYEDVNEEKQRLDPKCWKGYRKSGTKMKGGVRVNNCVKVKKG